MANYIIVGDPHIKYIAPTFRKETYFEELKDKLNQINIIAKNNQARVITLGDFFNSYVEDHFESIMYEISDMIYGWFSLIGNHDCKNTEGNLKGTSFGVLETIGYIRTEPPAFLDFYHYFKRETFPKPSKNKIALIHDYIMPKGTKENFEYKECQENDYRLVFCGHYHYPFDVTIGRTRYINPGSLMRSTVKELQLNRTPEVILFNDQSLDVQHIPLKVKPLTEVSNSLEENKLDKTFESKFADMILNNELTNNDSNDIINLLKKNNVESSVINYIDKKLKEIK